MHIHLFIQGHLACNNQARREPQRGWRNHYRGALSQPHSCAPRSRCPMLWEGGNLGRGVPSPSHHPTMGLGKRKLPYGVRGRAPAENWLCIFQVRKKPSGTPFSVFL